MLFVKLRDRSATPKDEGFQPFSIAVVFSIHEYIRRSLTPSDLRSIWKARTDTLQDDLIPITYSGNYGIVGCEEHTDTVVNALNELWTDLQASLKTPNTSTVYNKFFHGVDADRVNTILAHVALGTNITVNGKEFQPTIACATPKIPQVKPYWKFCQNHEVRSLHIKRTEHVILCPAMFQQKTAPENKDCARTRFDGLVSTGQGLARSVMSNLFHVLVQAYLGDHLEPELYGIHALLDLGASESVINPASYVFYVASTNAILSTPESIHADDMFCDDRYQSKVHSL